MPFTDLADYKAGIANQGQLIDIVLTTSAAVAGRPYDLWVPQVPPGSVPSSAVAPTSATAGSLGQTNPASGSLLIAGGRFNGYGPGAYLICDRLSHSGGLSGTVTTAQTTNLPTAALTRYTSGIGVMIGLTIYTAVGTTSTTVSVSYTDQDNNASTSPLVVFGNTGFREQYRMIQIPLAIGDTGVKSVQSVTVTATTTTAGNFGVTLYKPLYVVVIDSMSGVSIIDAVTGNSCGGTPAIVNDACLFCVCLTTGTVNTMGAGALMLAER